MKTMFFETFCLIRLAADGVTTGATQQAQATNDTTAQDTGATDQQGQQSQQNITVEQFEKLQQDLLNQQKRFDKLNTDYQKKQQELEAERKKSMSAQELEDMKRRESEEKLKTLERELNEKTLAFEKTQLISSKQLDPDFIALVKGDNIEEFKLNVEKFDAKINQLVEKKVNEKLAQSSGVPKNGNNKPGDDVFTKDEFDKISADRNAIAANYDKYLRSYKFYMKK
jgi:hypothetical protein